MKTAPNSVALRRIGLAALVLASLGCESAVGRVSGEVRDPKGSPLGDARLLLLAEDADQPSVTARSDGGGRFEVDLVEGAWSVSAALDGYSGADANFEIIPEQPSTVSLILRPLLRRDLREEIKQNRRQRSELDLATQLLRDGQWAQARATCESAMVQLDSEGQAEAWTIIAQCYKAEAKPQEAMSALGQGLKIEPGRTGLLILRAELRADSGDREGAAADLEIACALAPDNPVALERLIAALVGLGRLDDAESWARMRPPGKTLHARPIVDDAIAHYNRGAMDEARRRLDLAIALDPRAAKAYYFRGLCRSADKDAVGARLDLRRFCDMAPDDPLAPAARDLLGSLEGP